MNRDYSNAEYTTLSLNYRKEGYASLELHRTIKGEKSEVDRIEARLV